MKNKSYSKMVAIFALVLVTATSLWFALPATPYYAQGGYGAPAGGGGGELPSSYISFESETDSSGEFTRDVTAKSSDELFQLTIMKGTKALNKSGDRLSSILIVKAKEPPTPPPNANTIGLVYDLRPDGATFDPPITITFTYDSADLPEGTAEEDLVIAFWDEDADEWVVLEDITVAPETNTISAPVSHFTDFTVIAFTRPAAFTTSSLTISPTVVNIGQDITIGVTVTNTGDLAGNYEVAFKIDTEVIATRKVTLGGHASQKVTFSTTANYAAGDYTISVNGLSGTLTTKEPIPPTPVPAPTPAPPVKPPAPAAFATSGLSITPAMANIGEEVTINVLVNNTSDVTGSYKVTLKIDDTIVATRDVTLAGGISRTVTFTAARDVAGTYTISVDGLSGTFTVKAPPVPVKPINWWLIGGIIATVVIVTVAAILIVRRRRAWLINRVRLLVKSRSSKEFFKLGK